MRVLAAVLLLVSVVGCSVAHAFQVKLKLKKRRYRLE
jgi:hypothetical protein